MSTGFVFLDGRYLPGPYTLTRQDGGVFLNGVSVPGYTIAAIDEESEEEDEFEFAGPPGEPLSADVRLYLEVGYALEGNACIVAFTDQPLVTLRDTNAGYHLLKAMLGPRVDLRVLQTLGPHLAGDSASVQKWHDWLRAYRPPPELQQVARNHVARVDAVTEANTWQVSAVRRLHRLSSPLTMFGMFATILAMGHLLIECPARLATDEVAQRRSRLVARSLIIVVLLFGVDLVWTVLCSQAQLVDEMQPLGARLITDPAALIALKISLIVCCVVPLFALRHYQRAATLSWWACLVCTVLSLRWLTVNSMFLS